MSNLKVSITYTSMATTVSQRMIPFLLRCPGTNSLNQEGELWCPVPVCFCHGYEDGGSLAGPGEASVYHDRGFADDILLEQCNRYDILEDVLVRCGVV